MDNAPVRIDRKAVLRTSGDLVDLSAIQPFTERDMISSGDGRSVEGRMRRRWRWRMYRVTNGERWGAGGWN